ncbi:TPA: YfdQ family protein [Serratia marcescens]
MSQLDGSAIEQIKHLAIGAAFIQDLNHVDCPIAVLPKDVNVESLERYHDLRFRFRGNMETTSIPDFVKYSTQYAGEGVCCFIDADRMQAETIFNIGTLDEPGHADNKASITLKKTAPFSGLLDINGRKQGQKELAEWLEDNRDFLTAFDADGVVLDIKQAVGAVRRITIESVSTSDHEENDFSGKRSLMESVEAKSKDVMPAAFEFKYVPYEGLSERPFKLRYSIITNDKPILVLRIVQLEKAEEEIAVEFRDLLTSKFDGVEVETFISKFKA